MSHIGPPHRAVRGPAAFVVALFLAGCLGGGGGDAETVDPRASPTATFDDTTGAVEGAVIDVDTGAPVANATVGILTLNATTRTNLAGLYALSSLPPGRYSAITSHLRYEVAIAAVDVFEGQSTIADVALRPLPQPVYHEPFSEVVGPRNGRFNCALGYPGLPAGDPCSTAPVIAGPATNRVEVAKTPQQNVTGYLLTVDWEPSSVAGTNMQLEVNLPWLVTGNFTTNQELRECYKCRLSEYVAGTAIRVIGSDEMVAYVDTYSPDLAIVPPRTDSINVTVHVARGNLSEPNTWGGVAFQQDFQITVRWLYWGAPRPPGDDLRATFGGE